MRLWLLENLCRSGWELDQYVSEFESSVSGGYDNVVIDGNRNKGLRSGFTYSTVGGYINMVSGDSSSVSVGTEIIAGDDFSSYQWRLK